MTTEQNGDPALSPENAAVLEGMKALPVLTRKDFVSDQAATTRSWPRPRR
jgi:hypothetical protein